MYFPAVVESDTEAGANLEDNPSEWPEVAIIVLTWNNYEDTARCLSSLAAIEHPNFVVFVADNGSTDGSIERLQEDFDWCRFILNENNLGFAAGNNRAIERALAEDFDYILLLNNDTVPKPDFLAPLVETAKKVENVAAVGGLVYDLEDNIWSAGGYFSPTFVKLSHNTEPAGEVYETEFISGALMLLPREFIESIGGLNESYFFGMEDEEIAWEARRRGKKLLIDTRSKVHHDAGTSTSEGSPFRFYHDFRNRLLFASRNLSFHRAMIFYLFFTISRLVRFGQWIRDGKVNLVNVTLVALWDHLRGKPLRKPVDFD